MTVLRNEPNHVSFVLRGRKVNERFGLTRTRGKQWILVKSADGNAQRGSKVTANQPTSVRSGRTWRWLRVRRHEANTQLTRSALTSRRTRQACDSWPKHARCPLLQWATEDHAIGTANSQFIAQRVTRNFTTIDAHACLSLVPMPSRIVSMLPIGAHADSLSFPFRGH